MECKKGLISFIDTKTTDFGAQARPPPGRSTRE
jgi:hypothetical protein